MKILDKSTCFSRIADIYRLFSKVKIKLFLFLLTSRVLRTSLASWQRLDLMTSSSVCLLI